MKLLALDTCTEACSAAVYADGNIYAEAALTPRAHAQLLLPMVEKALAAAGLSLPQLDAIVVGRGPGAFTGIRIGMGAAQGLALAADKPVIPVSTLAALAQQAYQQHGATKVMAALDARMGEVYWGQYQWMDGSMALVGEEQVCPPSQVPVPDSKDCFACGAGWGAYPELATRLADQLVGSDPIALPLAAAMLPLGLAAWHRGEAVAAAAAQPVYLRNKVALTVQERLAQQ